MQAQVQPWLGNPADALTQSLWLIGRLKPAYNTQARANTNILFQEWLRSIAGHHRLRSVYGIYEALS